MNPLQATALRSEIIRTLKDCAAGPLAGRATALLGALGYYSEKTLALSPNDFSGFRESFLNGKTFNSEKALALQWESVDLLFQYTDAEVKASSQLALDVFADPRFDPGVYQSFVFFSIALTGNSYTRTQLADATREINKPFGMPAIVLFRHGATLTLAVIDRRLNKRDGTRDVLEKVTLIKDIRCTSPHRAHIEILADLTLDSLLESQPITNFDTLHTAWRKTLDTAALNKKFYKELADWYFWARKHVTFPPQAGVTAEVNHATNVIRLITRLMFTWFLKERGLVPEELFDERKLTALLQDSDLTGDGSTYYKAILQNLFFATLNTEMNDPVHPRRFRGESQSGGRDSHYGVTNVCRYADAFQDSARALALFKAIPFLNGGLFECLDQTAQGAPRVLVDGFSDRADNPLRVPNFLFFSPARDVDLNADYGTTGKITKVRGLLTILNSYKFTVAENTPIEEEIALDPELLGRVFENLLASYNPETGATARKQTGSFYTPREIVNYMVDEALIASLETALTPPVPASVGAPLAAPSSPSPSTPFPNREGSALAPGVGSEGLGLNARLRHLFAYNTDAPDFSPPEINTLINAIDALKILDPACGSGAFPMGILQKLVFVLDKLDPDNAQWRDRQIAKAELIDDPTARDHAVADINQAFDKNDLNYGRKLYLISNGIYGVDIQPIAMQIAKLRFFISLVIDQQIDDAAPNKGVRALPNLETKFVAANTLIGIDKPAQGTLRNPEIDAKEKQLKAVRERHFSARTKATKDKCRVEDERLRGEISALLESDGWTHDTAQRLAGWNPYDQNQTANFFDPEWMYGITDGFDICLANPPYIRQESIREQKPALAKMYPAVYNGTADLYTYFYARAVQLLKPGGMLAYITPNKWFRAGYGTNLRKFLAETCHIDTITDFGDLPVFDTATTYPMIFVARRANGKAQAVPTVFTEVKSLDPPYPDMLALQTRDGHRLSPDAISGAEWSLMNAASSNRMSKMRKASISLGDYVNNQIYYGVKTGFNTAFVIDGAKRSELIAADPRSDEIIKPLATGEDVRRWRIEQKDKWLIFTRRGVLIDQYPAVKHHLEQWQAELTPKKTPMEAQGRKPGSYKWYEIQDEVAYYKSFDKAKIVYPQIMVGPRFAFDQQGTYPNQKCFNIISDDKYLLGVLNSTSIWQVILEGSPALRGGYSEPRRDFVSSLPIPTASPEEQKVIATLVEYLLSLYSLEDGPARAGARVSLTRDYFEQMINGLVYELYFPEEIHAQNIRLFDLVSRAALPRLDDIPPGERLTRLVILFETLYNENHPLRGALFQLGSVGSKQ